MVTSRMYMCYGLNTMGIDICLRYMMNIFLILAASDLMDSMYLYIRKSQQYLLENGCCTMELIFHT